jgi:hypothetical protein
MDPRWLTSPDPAAIAIVRPLPEDEQAKLRASLALGEASTVCLDRSLHLACNHACELR